MPSSSETHYDVLGVNKTCSHDEIKAAFRKLSLQHHPDVAQDGCVEQFKKISNAHSILSNATERRRYDRELDDQKFWRQKNNGMGGGGFYGNDGLRRKSGPQNSQRGMHMAMETLFHPRYIALGVVGFASLVALSNMTGNGNNKHKVDPASPMVEAWKNPNTGRWEQPAPWDPLYRKLQPTLQLMPRDQVKRRNR
jgi:DnaJ-class molecular chaperone